MSVCAYARGSRRATLARVGVCWRVARWATLARGEWLRTCARVWCRRRVVVVAGACAHGGVLWRGAWAMGERCACEW